jgi:two-component system CheB/CheR fusion protein
MSEQDDSSTADAALEPIVEKVSTEHSLDVRGYKRSTLFRRIRKRMNDVNCATADDYLVLLESDRHEYAQLVNTILINVTEFFRDPEAWSFLQEECLAPLLRRKAPGEPVRAWCVGCASGEEAYSLAISVAELLGDRSLRHLKIYATDVDDGALAIARAGVYSVDDLSHVSPERLERYFDEISTGRYAVRRDLRSSVIFGRHNALVDPPISRLDVLICRNLLIYFDSDTQQQLLPRFHYALRDEGYLFLGKAETLMSRSLLFRPLEARYRIFQRVPQGATEEAMLSNLESRRARKTAGERGDGALETYLLHALVDQTSDPVLLLDPRCRLVVASPSARETFRISNEAMGSSVHELEERFRPGPLRLALEDARASGRGTHLDHLEFPRSDGTVLSLRANVTPILDPAGSVLQILFWGHDLSHEMQLSEELEHARQALETLGEELQTTNEELETSNEELQSTNEELEMTNEELQSTNEELETTVEELQSTNEELETANDELRARQEELNALARHQEMILAGLRLGLIVLDRSLVVTGWNKQCEEMWGVREGEAVGHELFQLDIGLPAEALRDPLTRLMQGTNVEAPVELEATNRRGRTMRCTIRLTPLTSPDGQIEGAIVLISGSGDRS